MKVGNMGGVVRLPARDTVLVDMEAVFTLRRGMAPLEFSEAIELVMFTLTRDLAVIERAAIDDEFERVRIIAQGLQDLSKEVGLMRLASVASDLVQVATANDPAAVGAITGRLVRLGEESLFSLVSVADGGPDIPG